MTTPSNPTPPFADDAVRAAFDRHPPAARAGLLTLRELVFDVADDLGCGPLTEALRWGQPAYLTTVSKSGTTLRLHAPDTQTYGLYVPCQTDLIAAFRARHGERLTYEGSRAVRFAVGDDPPWDVVRDCVALTLTYKARKRKAAQPR